MNRPHNRLKAYRAHRPQLAHTPTGLVLLPTLRSLLPLPGQGATWLQVVTRRPHSVVTKAPPSPGGGGPCKPGQTAASTGCTPASGGGGGGGGGSGSGAGGSKTIGTAMSTLTAHLGQKLAEEILERYTRIYMGLPTVDSPDSAAPARPATAPATGPKPINRLPKP